MEILELNEVIYLASQLPTTASSKNKKRIAKQSRL